MDRLRSVTRAIALAVVTAARDAGISALADDADTDVLVDAAMWWPDYVPYEPAADRRSSHV